MMRGNETENRLRTARRQSASGFSLIEILVVLVVLLIGILAVVRLFPPGFLILGRTYDLTVGQALSQQQLDTERNLLAPPEAIVSILPDASVNAIGQPIVDSSVRPDDLTDFSTGDAALNNRDPYYASNVNRFTRVMGEMFRIPIPTSNSGAGKGAVYTLQFGPVFNVFTTSGSGAPQDRLLVRGTPMERTEQSSIVTNNDPTGYANLRSDAEYAIDYKVGKIAFSPRNGTGSRKYVFEYDYYTTATPVTIKHNAGIIVVPDIPGTPPLPSPVWQNVFDAVNNIIPSDLFQFKDTSDDVSRQFVLMSVTPVESGGTPNFDGDPYEYIWYSKQQSSNANIGVLLFNPNGYDQVALNARGNKPLTARVDYTIFDNHIIRDDRVVPTGVPYTFRLTLNHLRVAGDILDNQATYNNFDPKLNPYNGLFRDNTGFTPDLIVVNTTTGDVVGTWQNNVGYGALFSIPGAPAFEPGSGTVTLNKAYVETNGLQSANLRCLYRAAKDWGMQVQKGSTHYLPATTATEVDFRHFLVAPAGSSFPTRIYFAPCDGGKTVLLGQYYDQSLVGTANENNPISNEAYQIVGDPALFDTFNLPYIDTQSKHPSFTGFSATQTGLPVLNVQGVSMKSRVVWRAGSRWHKLDTDTILAATPLK
jgi:prepilin-type N-terminal cleavage/methylation domain-containing protein